MSLSIISSHQTSAFLIRPILSVFFCLLLSGMPISDVQAHGTTIAPESRVYKCSFRDDPENPSNPACAEAVRVGGTQGLYDWPAISQVNANGNHRAVVPDGELCGGGNLTFSGLNVVRTDWLKTEIQAGDFEFVYLGTVPHATQDWVFYITKQGWNPNNPLAWDDLEEFCRHGDVPLELDPQAGNVYRMNCEIPERDGYQVIYNTWQRADSPEAFYACMDVEMSGAGVGREVCQGSTGSVAACVVPAIQLLID